MDLSKVHALTLRYPHVTNAIQCSVQVSTPLALLAAGETSKSETCLAIWDTGATASAIAELTAKKLQLSPIGFTKVSGLGGTIEKNKYIIDIVLPNNVGFRNVVVTEIDNPVDNDGNKVDSFGLLIGMDIIAAGDFTITSYQAKTTMTFRVPSMVCTDYVEEWNRRNAVQNKYKRR